MNTLLIYSGGLDSTVLLYWLRGHGHIVKALGVDYGQRHAKELVAARAVCENIAVPFVVADLSTLTPLLAGSSQTSTDVPVPEGHYADETMKQTVVPNRNMIMLAVAIGHAVSLKYDVVTCAMQKGDYPIYPDCRPVFAAVMAAAAQLCDWHPIRLERPFINKTKAELVRLGDGLGVPFAQTWSCYKGQAKHCGKCGTCVERREAFELAGVPDPTEYGA